MKKIIIILLVLTTVLSGCGTDNQQIGRSECQTDSDCVRGGCSGTICHATSQESMATTCEWKEEYGCFQKVNCGCVEGKCNWDDNNALTECINSKR